MAQQQPKTFPAPVDWDELYPGRFIKATDFKGRKVTLTMSAVKIEELVGDKGPQIKGVISFKGKDKQWALNKTNGICLKAMFGKKVQEWVGKRVTLFPSQWDGDDCIRVWGSPELQQDLEVTVALPRKRPFNMVMHRVAGPTPAAPSNANASPPPENGGTKTYTEQTAIAALKGAASDKGALDEAMADIQKFYASIGTETPLPVEDVYNMAVEALSSPTDDF